MATSPSSPLLAFAKLLVLLPYQLVVGFFGGLAWLLSWLPLAWVSAHRDIVITCLACFPDKSYAEIRALARQSLVETARMTISFPFVWQRSPESIAKKIRQVHGREAVQKAMESDRAVLLLSLHQSCWELQALELGNLGKVMIIYKPGSPLDQIAVAGREASGCVTVPTTGKGVRAALTELKNGGALCMLADHPPNNSQNPSVKFFNHDVLVPGFVHRVASDLSPIIFYIYTERVGPDQFDIHYQTVDDSMSQLGEQEFLQTMMHDMEKIILRAPEQYNLAYNRFRKGCQEKRYWYKREAALEIIQAASKGKDIAPLLAKHCRKN